MYCRCGDWEFGSGLSIDELENKAEKDIVDDIVRVRDFVIGEGMVDACDACCPDVVEIFSEDGAMGGPRMMLSPSSEGLEWHDGENVVGSSSPFGVATG